MPDSLSHLRNRLADGLDRIACALWSAAHRMRPVTPAGPLCPDCRIGPELPEDQPCPVCDERREQQRYEGHIYEQGRADAFSAMRDYE